MLNLILPEYRKWAPAVTDGLRSAAQFLHSQHIFDTRFLPYGSQLIPMSAIFSLLGTKAETVGARRKISRWYWSGVFGELYGGTTETRFARDVPEVVAWVTGHGEEPRTVQEAQFFSSRLWSLRTRGSAAYKGLYALLLKAGPVDWGTGSDMSDENYFDNAVDIHHVFPNPPLSCEFGVAGVDHGERCSELRRYDLLRVMSVPVQELALIPAAAWTPAYDDEGVPRDGAWVAEPTGVLDLSSWPKGMRVLVRKERPHPGAQLRFTDADGLRLTAFATNTAKGQLADLELRHRRRGRFCHSTMPSTTLSVIVEMVWRETSAP